MMVCLRVGVSVYGVLLCADWEAREYVAQRVIALDLRAAVSGETWP